MPQKGHLNLSWPLPSVLYSFISGIIFGKRKAFFWIVRHVFFWINAYFRVIKVAISEYQRDIQSFGVLFVLSRVNKSNRGQQSDHPLKSAHVFFSIPDKV